MTARNWRGSFTTPMTPFDENDRIDEDVLAAEVAFCAECGAGGMVTPIMVSEFRLLSEDERRTAVRVAVVPHDLRHPPRELRHPTCGTTV